MLQVVQFVHREAEILNAPVLGELSGEGSSSPAKGRRLRGRIRTLATSLARVLRYFDTDSSALYAVSSARENSPTISSCGEDEGCLGRAPGRRAMPRTWTETPKLLPSSIFGMHSWIHILPIPNKRVASLTSLRTWLIMRCSCCASKAQPRPPWAADANQCFQGG